MNSNLFLSSLLLSTIALSACAGTVHNKGINTGKNASAKSSFDLMHTKISTDKNTAVFHMAVHGNAGTDQAG